MTPPTTQERVDAALDYAARGLYIIPLHDVIQGHCSCGNPQCNAPGKHPRIADWANAASIDPAQIQWWWTQWPYANVGILTGQRSRVSPCSMSTPATVAISPWRISYISTAHSLIPPW